MNELLNKVLGLFIFCIVSPFIAAIFLILAIVQGWPVLFWQKRAGKYKKSFWMVKFRTMHKGAELENDLLDKLNEADGPVFKIKNDPRFTFLGRFLSSSGLDELPQLVNVMRGEMALVGPRPLPISEANLVDKKYAKRFDVLPGLTSSWVVAGTHKVSFKKWMMLDLEYVRSRSLSVDLKIILETMVGLMLRIISEIILVVRRYRIGVASIFIFLAWYFLIDRYVEYPLWQDWDEAMSFFASGAAALKSGTIPIWDKYMCGGQIGVAHPLSPYLSPFMGLMFLGVPEGVRLWIISYMAIGYYGMYKLLLSYSVGKPVALIGSVVYVFGGVFTSAIWGAGMLALLPLVLMPLIMIWVNQSYELPWPKYVYSSLKAGMVVAVMCISGLHYLNLPIIFIVVDSLTRLSIRWEKRLAIILISLSAFILFSAPKLFPEIIATYKYQRKVIDESGVGILTLARLMIDPTQTYPTFKDWYDTDYLSQFLIGHTPNLEENSIYVGVLVFLIFIYGIYVMIRLKSWRILVLLFIFIWLSLGTIVVPSIYSMWHDLPLGELFRESGRFRYIWYPVFIVIFSQGLSYATRHLDIRDKKKIYMTVLIVIVVDIFSVDINMINSFGDNRVGDNPHNPGIFTHVCSKNEPPATEMYEYIAAGYGIGETCHRSLPVPIIGGCNNEHDVSIMYQLLGIGTIESVQFATNSIYVTGSFLNRDKIIINMNYDTGWYVVYRNESGWHLDLAENTQGLLSYSISSGGSVEKIRFIYFSWPFGVGVVVLMVTMYFYLKLINPRV